MGSNTSSAATETTIVAAGTVPIKKTPKKRAARKHPGGQPTKYQTKYCEQLIEFFDIEPYREVGRWTTDVKSGREYVSDDDKANDLPTLERFTHKIGVNGDTLVERANTTWPEGHPTAGELRHAEFSAAYLRAKDLQKLHPGHQWRPSPVPIRLRHLRCHQLHEHAYAAPSRPGNGPTCPTGRRQASRRSSSFIRGCAFAKRG